MRTLVVEDDDRLRALLAATLTEAGWEVDEASDGRSGFGAALGGGYDVVLLDVMLPGMDGYSLQIKLAENDFTKEIPIIVFTALEPSKTLFQKFPQVKGFMTKPFKTEALLQSVENTIGKAN